METTPEKVETVNPIDRYLTPIAVLLGALIVAFALMYGRPASERDARNQAPAVDIADVKEEGEPYIGNPDAPTTIALYYDYQCPFCQQFELQVMPRLIEEYVSTGKTKVLFKDFQFLGQDSLDAAVYGRALWEAQPDKFYPWFVAVMEAQDEEGDEGFGDLASVRAVAQQVPGLDTARVDQLVAQNRARYEAAINDDRAEGASFGINGTPSVVVGKELLSGLTPADFYSAITAALEEQL